MVRKLERRLGSWPTPTAIRAFCLADAAPPSEPAKSVAFLNVQFLNDHEDLEPTTSAERLALP
jgi:hypothetical protein